MTNHQPPAGTQPEDRPSGSAVHSDDGQYRYLLAREWADGPVAAFVMLNPSTADAHRDDPTIRRCIRYARDWDCGALLVANLYAWRATRPADLWRADDPVGPESDAYLCAAAETAARTGGPIIAAWGNNAQADRIAAVLDLPGMDRLSALAITKSGQPGHPLYLPADLTPAPWNPR